MEKKNFCESIQECKNVAISATQGTRVLMEVIIVMSLKQVA
jgi:hypothetical protein